MNIVQLYRDYNIIAQTEGHKHCRPGWINTECPFCTGNPGLHLGATLDGSRFYCWRCGYKPVLKALSKLLNLPPGEVRVIVRSYGGRAYSTPTQIDITRKPHRLPNDTGPMEHRHRQYLIKRRFDPEKLEQEWGLLGTGPMAYLDHVNANGKRIKIDFRHRIVAPIFWEGQQVSYQARDFTNKSDLRYITCPKEREIVHHKDILYGRQESWESAGICVEGITDVWRFGPRAFATFGIEYKRRQMMVMAKSFKRIFVVFDDDPQAINQAKKLEKELLFRGVEAQHVVIEGDPGGMEQTEADYFVKQLLG